MQNVTFVTSTRVVCKMYAKCRGRPKYPRWVEHIPEITYFEPIKNPPPGLAAVCLSVEELEAMRLVDLEELQQEQAAVKMGISRKALWTELQNARKKVTGALTSGRAIEIKGGNYMLDLKRKFECYNCQHEWEEAFGTGRPDTCPVCESVNIRSAHTNRGYARGRRGFMGGE